MSSKSPHTLPVDIDKIGLYRAPETNKRSLLKEILTSEITVAGGGIAGVCAAIAGARQGCKVILCQDRPVLGGNASSEIRLWILGATSHMGNNNRWSRESGIMGEILVENMYRNPEGNPLIFDVLLLEKITKEAKITLLLNTAVTDVTRGSDSSIESIAAYCSQNATTYQIQSDAYIDCTGDGTLSFMAGAAFRMGAETREEFNEKMAPKRGFGYLLGHSLYFYSKDTGKPVRYIKPAFADKEIDSIHRYRSFSLKDQGCNFWWVEYGGRMDTVHETEAIKWELWKVVYGIWDYIKNSGKFPESETHTLEWVGTIPGKRESRRFEGLKMITQQDIIEQRKHDDAVAYGGWALDLHPADGVYSKMKPCVQYHSRGIYSIPLGATLSRNIPNLAFGGRIISASHVAFGSTRVMATCGYLAQATAIATAYAVRQKIKFQALVEDKHIKPVQHAIQKAGQHIPNLPYQNAADLVNSATIKTSSVYKLYGFSKSGSGNHLNISCAMLLPFKAGPLPRFKIGAKVKQKTELNVQIRQALRPECFTPERILEEHTLLLEEGYQDLEIAFKHIQEVDGYLFICFLKNPDIVLDTSKERLTGVLALFNGVHQAVSNQGRQNPEDDCGVETFEFWCPMRRPKGENLALRFDQAIYEFSSSELNSGFNRPTHCPNAWLASRKDTQPQVDLYWKNKQSIRKVAVCLDTDFDHAMESVLMGHPETVMPFCVRSLSLHNETGNCLGQVVENYQTEVVFEFDDPIETSHLTLKVSHPMETIPAAIFSIQCYA